MAPSLGFTDVETDRMNRKRKRTKDFNANPEDHENADGSERKQKKKKRGKEDLTVELVELVAKYLSKRGLSKTLAALISESQCKNTWEIQTLDLEDIYSNFSNQNREKSLKHKAEERNLEQANDALLEDLGNQNEDVIFQEQGFKTKDGGIVSRKVDNAKEASSGSGALKEGLSETDKSEDSCDDDQDEHAQKKKTKKSGVGKNIKPVSDNILAKKRCLGLVIIADRKNENSTKDTTKPPKPSNESEKVLELNDSVHESLKVLTERTRKKKMTSEENDSRDNELEKVLELAEPVHGSLKAPENRRGKKMTSKEKDSGDNDKQSSGKKNKKGKSALKKKLQSTGSHVYEEAMEGSMKDSTGDSSKSLDNIQDPMTSQAKEVVEKDAVKSVKDSAVANRCKSGSIFGQKEGIKAEETEGNISENLKKIRKQNPDVPTAAKAFQRVKVEEVKFVDPRLQDNSYWAKGGAENGYGAKAEGVLGQVRGKDFRHEKTKKKRGSYKGGIIDLQSHSVKFNYSDEE